MQSIDGLKREVFERLMDMAGRVFVVVKHSGEVRVGRRGFTEAEKENGLVLVFNHRMNFTWTDEGIEGRLLFGGKPEDCFIPSKDIALVYSPELGAQFLVTGEPESKESKEPKEEAAPEPQAKPASEGEKDTKLIKVDFSKGK